MGKKEIEISTEEKLEFKTIKDIENYIENVLLETIYDIEIDVKKLREEIIRELPKMYKETKEIDETKINEIIENKLEKLELLDYITLKWNSKGQKIVKLTNYGKTMIEAKLKKVSFLEKVINWIIYNPIVKKILNL